MENSKARSSPKRRTGELSMGRASEILSILSEEAIGVPAPQGRTASEIWDFYNQLRVLGVDWDEVLGQVHEQFPKLDQGNSSKSKIASLEMLIKALEQADVKDLPQEYQDYLKKRIIGLEKVRDRGKLVKDLKDRIALIRKDPRAHDFGHFVGIGEGREDI